LLLTKTRDGCKLFTSIIGWVSADSKVGDGEAVFIGSPVGLDQILAVLPMVEHELLLFAAFLLFINVID